MHMNIQNALNIIDDIETMIYQTLRDKGILNADDVFETEWSKDGVEVSLIHIWSGGRETVFHIEMTVVQLESRETIQKSISDKQEEEANEKIKELINDILN